MRVFECQTRTRNESEFQVGSVKGAPSTDLDFLMMDLSKSMYVGTRKMVNYA